MKDKGGRKTRRKPVGRVRALLLHLATRRKPAGRAAHFCCISS